MSKNDDVDNGKRFEKEYEAEYLVKENRLQNRR